MKAIDFADILAGIAIYGGGALWLGWTIYQDGFTEPVVWIMAAIGAVILIGFVMYRASMDLGAAMGAMFLAWLIGAVFVGALILRLFQIFIIGDA